MPYFIGLDIGTSSTKAIAVTPDGKLLCQARKSYSMESPRPGYHEQSPEVLLAAARYCLIEAASQAGRPPEGIGFSCAMHSLIAIGEGGQPISQAILWSDRRSEPVARILQGSPLGRQLYRETGTPIHAMSPLCKLHWLKEHEPALFERSARFISIKEFILHALTGEYAVDYGIASASGLMDIRQLCWHAEALAFAGIRESQLSPLHAPTFALKAKGKLAPSILRGVPLVLGGSDGCLANLGVGALGPEVWVVTIGTSGAVRATARQPVIDEAAQLFNYRLDEAYFVYGGATNNGGILYEWLSELVGEGRLSEPAAAALPAGAEGLLFLPYLLGERAPVWDASARGAFLGLDIHHKAAHFHRALLEGVAFSLRHISESIPAVPEKIKATGGFIRSPLWVQIIADVFGAPVEVDDQEEASAHGAALMAMKALGHLLRYEEWAERRKPGQTYSPRQEAHEAYQKGMERFKRAYPALRGINS